MFRTFGLFAALSLAANYFLLMSFLPAVLLLQRRQIDPLFRRMFTFDLSVRDRLEFLINLSDELIDGHLPAILIHGRFVWITCFSLLVGCCGWLSATRLNLPQYNPLQLYIGSNPNEFYDNNAERLFSFVEGKIALPLTLRLVWGINAIDKSSHFDTREVVQLKADSKFHVRNADEMRLFAANLLRFRTLYFVQHDAKFWPERLEYIFYKKLPHLFI
jgi:hypothetical protein